MRVPPLRTLIAGRYEVQGYLGSGTYGDVYEVLDRHQGANYALKLLNPAAGIAGGIWDEAELLTRLESPYILRIWNADFDAGIPFIVTELARGGSADKKMDPLGVPHQQAIRWTRAACRGAARAHEANLVHRDIKPGNLMIDSVGEARLGDFGIAHLLDINGQAPSQGTPVTAAPEVLAGGPTSVVTDVYSLGASLYALLSGRYPASVGLRDIAPHVSQGLAQRVAAAMADDPADRYGSAMAFDAALGSLPAATRSWARTDEHHPAHQACWRGSGGAKAEVTVCLVPNGKRYEVEARHVSTGNRVLAGCKGPVPPSAVPRNLRVAIAAVA